MSCHWGLFDLIVQQAALPRVKASTSGARTAKRTQILPHGLCKPMQPHMHIRQLFSKRHCLQIILSSAYPQLRNSFHEPMGAAIAYLASSHIEFEPAGGPPHIQGSGVSRLHHKRTLHTSSRLLLFQYARRPRPLSYLAVTSRKTLDRMMLPLSQQAEILFFSTRTLLIIISILVMESPCGCLKRRGYSKSPHRYYHCSSRSNNTYLCETSLQLSSSSLAIACAYRRRYSIGAACFWNSRDNMSSEIYPEDLYRMKSTPKITELNERSCLVQSFHHFPSFF